MSDCEHDWVLDRPESETWECLDCGAEGSGYGPPEHRPGGDVEGVEDEREGAGR